MAFRFVHTGDLHLDSPFVGLTTEAPASVVDTLRDSTVSAWRNIVQLTLSQEADFLLVAGDVFEHANRTLRGQLVFREGLARLADAGIASFVVTGNHDPLDGWEPSVTWPDMAHRFPAGEVTSRPVTRGGSEIARVHGISYHQRDIKENLARRFGREAGEPFAIGLLHANVGGEEGHANYAPCTLADLRDSGMDYWALGHIHAHRVLSTSDPVIVYCGNPQGRDPGETEPRGCYVVDVDDAGRIDPRFEAVDVVRWQLLELPVDGLATEEALIGALIDVVGEAQESAGRSIVARVRLTGRGPLRGSLTRSGVLEDVLTASREGLSSSVPFAWIESLRDRTRPDIDLDERRKADDFLGDLLRRLGDTREQLTRVSTPGDEAAPGSASAELEGAIDELYANSRARKYLRHARPAAAELVRALDEAEPTLVDRLTDED